MKIFLGAIGYQNLYLWSLITLNSKLTEDEESQFSGIPEREYPTELKFPKTCEVMQVII